MTAVATRPAGALAVSTDQDGWTEAQAAALTQLWGGKQPPRGDLLVFLNTCQKTGLDPFARQLYMIERGGRWGIQTGIDGFRVVRDRIAAQRGCSVSYADTLWCGQDGTWTDVWLQKQAPAAAKVGLTITDREGRASTYSTVALWSEYGADSGLWRKMPALMLAKCAEAQTLRKAFPHDLSGLYTSEELAQQDSRVVEGTVAVAAAPDPGALQTLWSGVVGAADQDQLRDAWTEAKRSGHLDSQVADPITGEQVTLGQLVLLTKDRLDAGLPTQPGQAVSVATEDGTEPQVESWPDTVQAPEGGHPMDLPTEAEAQPGCAYQDCTRAGVVDGLWCLQHDPAKDSQSPVEADPELPRPGRAAMAKARAELAAKQAQREQAK